MSRILILMLILLLPGKIFSQQDYFVAEDLANEGKNLEAVKILNRLIDSNAYVDRPAMHMKTLNLAGQVNHYLQDSARSKFCFRSAIAYYDTLSHGYKENMFIKREWFISCEELSEWAYDDSNASLAIALLRKTGPPGEYYSSTGHDVLVAKDRYYGLMSASFEMLTRPDSAFWYLCLVQEDNPLFEFGLLFRDTTNQLESVSIETFIAEQNEAETEYAHLYVATWRNSNPQTNTVWAVRELKGPVHLLGKSDAMARDSSGFPLAVDNISLSGSNNLLAVQCHAEGNTWIDIISFDELIHKRKYVENCSIDPYPGIVSLLGWQDNLVIVESDADLTKLNKSKRLSMRDLFGTTDDRAEFLFDPEKKKYTKR